MSDTLEKSADRLIELATRQAARIEALEAALRAVLTNEIMTARNIARTALNKDGQ